MSVAVGLLVILVIIVLLIELHFESILGCGTTTHIEIGHRATEYFEDNTGGINYKQLIVDNQDAFQAGNPYPDAFYPSICRGGQFHQVSEDSHWVPFLNATINYIRRVYPQPWDKETQKLVVFMLGFASHQVADVSWHSLGIDQGFLAAMGDINFFGNFDAAHSVGDIGGDVIAQFEFNLTYISSLSEWYVPTQDLVGIYKDLYGLDIVNSSLIEECTILLYLERLGEKLAFAKLFPDYATKSPFLVDQFQSYFLGGLDDMSTWTTNVWHEAIQMLDKGTSTCNLPRNPLYINCHGNTTTTNDDKKMSPATGLHTNGYLRHDLTLDLIKKRQTNRGVYLTPSETFRRKARILHKRAHALTLSKIHRRTLGITEHSFLQSTLVTSNAYAHLGWSTVVGDINSDGTDDLITGAPGYGLPGNPQNGRVFGVLGNRNGTLPQRLDLDTEANFTLSGTETKNGHFGSAIAILDVDQDGLQDLAVSAPSTGSASLNYTGAVHVFLAQSPGVFGPRPNVTVTCQLKYCNLGWSLATADLNQDGYSDLIIGSPFVARGDQSQSGALWVLYSSKDKRVRSHLSVENDATILLQGDQQYGWLGYSVIAKPQKRGHGSWLLVSQPTYRICANTNCDFSQNDVQNVGRLLVYSTDNMTKPVKIVTGRENFANLGSAFGIGDPYNIGREVVAVGADTTNVLGEILGVSTSFTQAGNVKLYNLTSTTYQRLGQRLDMGEKPVALLEGDRRLGRFGESLLVDDVTGDGVDDIVISAPLRIDDITEELYGGEQGAVYVFGGGVSLLQGNITRHCDLLHKVIEPCPGDKAFAVLTGNEAGSRFGHRLVSWKRGQTPSLVISAHRSSLLGRLAGSVFVYSGFKV